MALFEVDFPEDFLSGLLDSEFEDIAKEALEETAPILTESMKKEIRSTVKHKGESELVDSIQATKPKRTKTDAWIANVTPKGYSDTKVYTAVDSKGRKTHRKYPVSNALKAIWKEYGIPGKQAPSPFLDKATRKVRQKVMNRIQEVYNRKTGVK